MEGNPSLLPNPIESGPASPRESPLPSWSPEPPPQPETAPAASRSLDAPPWTFADLGWFLVFVFSGLLLSIALTSAGYSLLRELLGWGTPLRQAMSQMPLVVVIQMTWEALWLLFIYATITRKYRRRFWESIRWIWPPRAGPFLLAGIGLAAVLQWVSYLSPPKENLPVEQWFSSTEAAYLLAVFGICVAPFIEELVFRGFFYPVLERQWGLWAAVFLTAFFFALMHASQLGWGWKEISLIFLVGLVLSYSRGKTGSLVPSYLMHLSYNATLFLAMYFATDRFRELNQHLG